VQLKKSYIIASLYIVDPKWNIQRANPDLQDGYLAHRSELKILYGEILSHVLLPLDTRVTDVQGLLYVNRQLCYWPT